jgi:phosphate transport system substrate-binding protein
MVTRLSMIRKVAVFLFFIGLCLFGQATAQEKAGVRVKGSNEWANVVEGWASRFMGAMPSVIVVVSGGGTKSGIEAVLRNEVNIAMAAHFLDQDQKKTAADLGIDLQEKLVSWDAVAVFVNRENPVSELTIDQVRSLFIGEVTRWNNVGGRDAPVELYVDETAKSEIAALLRKLVLAGAEFAPNSNVRRYPKFIIQAVSEKKNSIGYAPLGRVIEFQNDFPVKLLAIRSYEEAPAILPSKETVANETYPVILPLFFYWDGKSAGKPVTDFITFCEQKVRPGGGK